MLLEQFRKNTIKFKIFAKLPILPVVTCTIEAVVITDVVTMISVVGAADDENERMRLKNGKYVNSNIARYLFTCGSSSWKGWSIEPFCLEVLLHIKDFTR